MPPQHSHSHSSSSPPTQQQPTPLPTIRASDPDHAGVEVDNTPSPAAPTNDPHRITFVVPTPDLTVLSLGMGAPLATRIKDTGITGRTKTHVHFHTTETPKTMVLLGNPTQEGWDAYKGNVLGTATGFAMVTEGSAWMDANTQFYVVSRTGQVVLRAVSDKVRLQADAKNVELAAEVDVVVGAKSHVSIVADGSATLNDNGYQKNYDDAWTSSCKDLTNKNLMTVLDLAASLQGLYTAFSSLSETGSNFKSGWVSDANGVLKFGLDCVKVISTVGRFFHSKSAEGQVKITGENYVSMTGGIAASMFGNLSASVTSVLSASLLGGSASVKGMTWTSVWAGLGVSVKTLTGKAELKSEKGKANVSAKKDVAIASKEGMVTIKGKKGAQLNTDGRAVVHAKSTTFVGAGGGNGYGIIMKESDLQLGAISNMDSYEDVSMKDTPLITVSSKKIETKHGNSFIRLADDCIELEAYAAYGWKVDSSGNFQVEGSKILIG